VVLFVRLLAILLVVLLDTLDVCWDELILACLWVVTEETYIVAMAATANAIPIPNVALESSINHQSWSGSYTICYLKKDYIVGR
jgi:hypothetical protein